MPLIVHTHATGLLRHHAGKNYIVPPNVATDVPEEVAAHLESEFGAQRVGAQELGGQGNADGASTKNADGEELGGPGASDAAIKLAADAGLDLAEITGTGKGGRIVAGDVEKAIAAKDAS